MPYQNVIIQELNRLQSIDNIIQARNKEFLRAGEFSWNQGTVINIHLQQKKEKPRREKNHHFFSLEILNNCILNEKLYPQMTTIRAYFPQIRPLFSNFRKRTGETSAHLLQLRTCKKTVYVSLTIGETFYYSIGPHI